MRASTNCCAFTIQEEPADREKRTRPEREREAARLAAEAEAKRQRAEQWARDGATMLYTFEASHETHLAATEREQVLMLEPQSDRTDGWCRVQNSAGVEGLVPIAYLETFENRNARQRAVAAELKRASEEAQIAAQQQISSMSDVAPSATLSKAAPVLVSPAPVNANVDPSRQHVMVSYAWDGAKDRVVRLCDTLREHYQIDVWRDETGSTLLGPMADSVNAHMAKAVELSSAIIVCVSRKYTVSISTCMVLLIRIPARFVCRRMREKIHLSFQTCN